MRILILCLLIGSAAFAQTSPSETSLVKQPSVYGSPAWIHETFYSVSATDTVLDTTRIWKFDEQHRLEWVRTEKAQDGEKTVVNGLYLYWDGATVRAISRYENDRRLDSIRYEYDRKGLLRRTFSYDQKDRAIANQLFSYNGKEQLISILKKGEGNKLEGMIRYDYRNDSLVAARIYDHQMRYTSREEFQTERQSDGNYLKMHFQFDHPDTCSGMQSALLDQQGRELERTIADGERRVVEYTTLTYNDDGLLASLVSFSDVKTEQTFRYTIDSLGNWTERRVFEDTSLVSFSKREFLYSKRKR